jgi:hypothetical protein
MNTASCGRDPEGPCDDDLWKFLSFQNIQEDGGNVYEKSSNYAIRLKPFRVVAVPPVPFVYFHFEVHCGIDERVWDEQFLRTGIRPQLQPDIESKRYKNESIMQLLHDVRTLITLQNIYII